MESLRSNIMQRWTKITGLKSTKRKGEEESRELIKKSIDVWSQYAQEYQPGKNTKVCDLNIDEIYYNLVMGYLALGEGEGLNNSWKKCLEIEGNSTAEAYAKEYVERMVGNADVYIKNKGKGFEPLEIMTDKKRYNDMIFLKGIFSVYLMDILCRVRMLL